MICSVIVNCKRLGASFKRTFERSLFCVNQLMVNLAVVLVFKSLSTFIANKRPIITVSFFVPFQCILRWELGVTFVTREVQLAGVFQLHMLIQKTSIAKGCLLFVGLTKQTHMTHLLMRFDVTIQCLDVLEFLPTLVTLGFRLALMGLQVNVKRFLSNRKEPVLKEPPTGGLGLASEGAQVAVKLSWVLPVEHCMHLLLLFSGKPLPTKRAGMQVEGADIMMGLVVVDRVGRQVRLLRFTNLTNLWEILLLSSPHRLKLFEERFAVKVFLLHPGVVILVVEAFPLDQILDTPFLSSSSPLSKDRLYFVSSKILFCSSNPVIVIVLLMNFNLWLVQALSVVVIGTIFVVVTLKSTTK